MNGYLLNLQIGVDHLLCYEINNLEVLFVIHDIDEVPSADREQFFHLGKVAFDRLREELFEVRSKFFNFANDLVSEAELRKLCKTVRIDVVFDWLVLLEVYHDLLAADYLEVFLEALKVVFAVDVHGYKDKLS